MNVLNRGARILALSATIAACATTGKSGGKPASNAATVITRAEMEKVRYASLYEAVQSLRGRWLQPRGPNSFLSRPSEIQVILDDMRMGGVENLRAIRSDNVVSVVFVDPITATQRWGGKHVQGTIVVTTHADGVP